MEKVFKQKKGITLIALVITIIVLLILAGISISMLSGDNSILQKATDAKTQTGIGQEKETIALAYNTVVSNKTSKGDLTAVTDTELDAQLSSDNAGAKAKGNPIKVIFYSSKREYTISDKGIITYIGTKNEDTSKKVGDLEVGDYVNYGEKLTVKTYQTNPEETGANSSQTFKTDNQMLWRVMNKKDNGNVEIVAVSNILDTGHSGYYWGLVLSSPTGFLHAEDVLNNMCDELYSSDCGIGRSINVDDINKLNSFNPETDSWTDLDSESFVTSKTYGVSCNYTYGPVWNEENNEINTASSSNPLNTRHTHYSYYVSPNMPLYNTLANGIQNDDITTYYWLASRCWNANNSGNGQAHNYNMQVRFMGMGTGQTSRASVRDWSSYSTDMGGYILSGPGMCGVRPVVTLDGSRNIQNDSTKDGKSEAKAYSLE